MATNPDEEVAMEVEPRLSLDELKRLERGEKDAGQAKRLRTVILAMEGWTAPAIAMAVGLSSKQLLVPENVSLITLPPYIPELSPIENLWHYLKSHFWSNCAYDDYDALEQAAVDAWRKAALDKDLMKTVCAAPYLERANSS